MKWDLDKPAKRRGRRGMSPENCRTSKVVVSFTEADKRAFIKYAEYQQTAPCTLAYEIIMRELKKRKVVKDGHLD